MAVDFTRTAQSVTARGADPNVILERDQIKTDLRALIAPRETSLPWDKAIQLMNDLNYELIEPLELDADFSQGSPTPSLQQFVILDRKWAPVEPRWFGHFFNKDSYIIIARYWVGFEYNLPFLYAFLKLSRPQILWRLRLSRIRYNSTCK